MGAQSANFHGELAYYDYDGISDDMAEKERLAEAIGSGAVVQKGQAGTVTAEERPRSSCQTLARSALPADVCVGCISDKSVLVMRNHGVCTTGRS